MKVTTVSASVRFSKKMDDGAFKTVELSAEATLAPQEPWQQAQGNLYDQLGQQLKALWSARNGGEQRNGDQTTQDTTNGHFCSEHGVAFQRYEKGNQAWFSHKIVDGKWCREK